MTRESQIEQPTRSLPLRVSCALLTLIGMLASLTSTALWAQADENMAMVCGALENAYGPYDYTDPSDFKLKLPIVEGAHFTSDVENLRKGKSSTIMGDLDYTLRAFPNHHRALNSMAKYLRDNPAIASQFRTADCYFDRAMRFRPRDATVRMIYGSYLFKRGDRSAALQRYEEALAIGPESAELHYNMGLLQVELKHLDVALEHAQKAYAMGYPLQGLKHRLQRAGAWRDPS